MPHKLEVGATPFKAVYGNNPNVSHLRFFCSKAWVRIPMDKRKGFEAQSRKCILLGYVVIKLRFVQNPMNNPFQKFEVNFISLSETISFGIVRFQTLS